MTANWKTVLFWLGYALMIVVLAKCWFKETPRIYHGYDEVIVQHYEPKN